MSSTEYDYEARCMCGAVAYGMVGEPIMSVYCHCSMCRKHTGAPFVHSAAWMAEKVTVVSGDGDACVIAYNSSDAFTRGSCAACGGAVANAVAAHGMIGFPVGIIDGAYVDNTYKSAFKPACHLFYGNRVVDIVDGLPKLKAKSPEDGVLPETATSAPAGDDEGLSLDKVLSETTVDRDEEMVASLGGTGVLKCVLDDGTTSVQTVNLGQTVQYLKLLLAEAFEKPISSLSLSYNDEPLIDPISICDCIPEAAFDGEVVINVSVQ
ncbi:uncharacterized protein AMSG_11916 [Thecamonas trahens ATCC 50062]|uniref:CENP-V/GFA domain-containing protein n=1 Tax=Thecamonas trahens ATCC 50062 TaxID=461836 RepID=A0A0L0DCQ5_THETB|nr:hypothetical protein AMSG_11916 [Thecamonas trahens ATCC 50062]KNC50099.1 hypothetical protein AMSG_11916 [Thecamonas trahens ATCC 50062]|eukprot:XP_013757309.1 hypothetical protein AMSG_11916 [Thecamonas trahens ATCC 50062]